MWTVAVVPAVVLGRNNSATIYFSGNWLAGAGCCSAISACFTTILEMVRPGGATALRATPGRLSQAASVKVLGHTGGSHLNVFKLNVTPTHVEWRAVLCPPFHSNVGLPHRTSVRRGR